MNKNRVMKKIILGLIEYIVVFVGILAIGLWINQSIQIKGLYMDDLFNWSWFPKTNLYDFAFKFYGASRYRPFFDMLQYIEYMIVGTNVFWFAKINILLNSFLGLFVYFFAKKLSKRKWIAIVCGVLYIVSHFAYYQIGQVLGLLETEAQFFALLILFLSFKLVGLFDEEETNTTILKNVILTIIIMLLYFIEVFTHERYLCLAPIIVLSILFAKKPKVDISCLGKQKRNLLLYRLFTILIFVLEIGLICYIRNLAIGKILPAGTGGTNVEETFNLLQCIKFCFSQVLFIFGINNGKEYLVGIEYADLPTKIKFLGLASIVVIIIITIIYIIIKMHNNAKKEKSSNIIIDILFLMFIALCIGASSVTIRVEMRFVYVSFTASVLYMSYMSGSILEFVKDWVNKFTKLVMRITMFILLILFFGTRFIVECEYRKSFNKIHFFLDLDRVNSLYDNTIGKYGLDEILHNRKIYMVNTSYGFTQFYADWFFKIYDNERIGNSIILLDKVEDLPIEANSENSILIIEDGIINRMYLDCPIKRE